MKKMMGVFAMIMATSLGSQACSQFEAQFIGKVSKIVTSKSGEACLVQVSFESFESSMMCPLDISEVDGQYVKSTSCTKKVGEAISGYMVRRGTSTFIE